MDIASVSKTSSNLVTASHIWKIDNFSHRCSFTSEYILESNPFSPAKDTDVEFRLLLYPYGHNSTRSDTTQFAQIGFKFMKYKTWKRKIRFKTNVWLKNMETGDWEPIKFDATNWISIKNGEYELLPLKIQYKDISQNYLQEDTLTILFKVSYITDSKTTTEPVYKDVDLNRNIQQEALKRFETLFESATFPYDVTLCIEESNDEKRSKSKDKDEEVEVEEDDDEHKTDNTEADENEKSAEIKVHKAILAHESQVFAAMFANDMKESRENKVKITDMSSEVAQAMVDYLYGRKIDSLDEIALDLFKAAHKYEIEKLENHCVKFLAANLSTNSVLEVLEIANLYSKNYLKNKALKFIKRNAGNVLNTEQFEEFDSKHPELSLEVYRTAKRQRVE